MNNNLKPIFIDFEASSLNGFPIQVAYGTNEVDLKYFLIKPIIHWNEGDYLWDYTVK